MYESRAYDKEYGDPVVVLVVTGTHDVSRLIQLFKGRGALVEQLLVGDTILRQVKRHNRGRDAVALLKAHGGPDFTDEQSPTDPAGLGAWLRKLPVRTIVCDHHGTAWQRGFGHVTYHPGDGRVAQTDQFPALLPIGSDVPFGIEEPEDQSLGDLVDLALAAPFTVLRVGDDQPHADGD